MRSVRSIRSAFAPARAYVSPLPLVFPFCPEVWCAAVVVALPLPRTSCISWSSISGPALISAIPQAHISRTLII